MTFEIVTRYGPYTNHARVTGLPVEVQNLVPARMSASSTASEEWAANALVKKLMAEVRSFAEFVELSCTNPSDHYTVPKLWKAVFRKRRNRS